LVASLILTYVAIVLKLWERNRPPQLLTVRRAGLLVLLLSVLVAPLCSGYVRFWWNQIVPYQVDMLIKLAFVSMAIVLLVNLLLTNSDNRSQRDTTKSH
jgi:hypothetical protein